MGASHRQLNKFLICGKILRFRLQIKIDGFSDILDSLIFSLTLRPAAFQSRNMSHEISIFPGLNYDFDVHISLEISIIRKLLEASQELDGMGGAQQEENDKVGLNELSVFCSSCPATHRS
jgi:hypothetical protein